MEENKQTKKRIGSARAAAIGMVAGAAVGIAATTVLRDQKTIKRVGEAIGQIRDQAIKTVKQVRERSKDMKNAGMKEMMETKNGH